MNTLNTELDTRKSAADLVEAWTAANDLMTNAERDLDRAKKILEAAFGPTAYMDTCPNSHLSTWKDVKKANTRAAWKQIIEKLGIRKTMSIARLKEMDKNIDEGKMQEITFENILGISASLVENAPGFAAEAIQEVFTYLRPGARERNTLKTNAKYARYSLGKKVILTSVSNWRQGRPDVSYWNKDQLIEVDRVFHLADGNLTQVFTSYASPLLDAMQSSTGKGSTDYFKFEVYGNGNLHLTFLRPDLVEKLNRAAAGHVSLAGN